MWQINSIFILRSRTTEVHSSSPKQNAHGRSFSGRPGQPEVPKGIRKGFDVTTNGTYS